MCVRVCVRCVVLCRERERRTHIHTYTHTHTHVHTQCTTRTCTHKHTHTRTHAHTYTHNAHNTHTLHITHYTHVMVSAEREHFTLIKPPILAPAHIDFIEDSGPKIPNSEITPHSNTNTSRTHTPLTEARLSVASVLLVLSRPPRTRL